jgi:hypothetical protein
MMFMGDAFWILTVLWNTNPIVILYINYTLTTPAYH